METGVVRAERDFHSGVLIGHARRCRAKASGVAVQFRELAPNLAFAFAEFCRNLNLHFDKKIAARVRRRRQTMPAQTKTLSALRTGWNFEAGVTAERRHLQLSAERRLLRRQLHFVD